MSDLLVYAKPVRSTFLTILCILTMVGSSYSIISNVFLYVSADKISRIGKQNIDRSRAANMQSNSKQRSNRIIEDSLAMLDESKMRYQAIGLILANLLTLAGGIVMFTMRQWGFWLYLAGSILHIGMPLYLFGFNTIPGIIAGVAQSMISAAFIIMYAFQLKDMRPKEILDDGLLR